MPVAGEGLCDICKFYRLFPRMGGIDHLKQPLALIGATILQDFTKAQWLG